MGQEKRITLTDGAGGEKMMEFIRRFVLANFGGNTGEIPLGMLDDSSIIDGIAFTTDTYVVKPLFFPGGNIGSLAISGTVNDLSVMGATPVALSCGLILSDGFPLEDLDKILRTMRDFASKAGVSVVTGDTKVVEKSALEGIFINTSGIGKRSQFLDGNIKAVRESRKFSYNWPNDSAIAEGDKIIISGTVGDHGVALLSFREGYGFESKIKSDAQPLNHMIAKALKVGGITAMKDATRGGVANALNEWAEKSKVGIVVEEDQIPYNEAVLSACEMLGIDPLEIGNEGKALIAVVPQLADDVLKALKKTDEGKEARIIGEASKECRGVTMRTSVGGLRIVESPIGDPAPRIC
ncbi:MAG TPA: hydrogenase expression/formation protein HypE [Thermoplasmata archaeon]|nr:hydrogenase expression/formation protein HypE [Thermoplasmata archaeon]